VDDEALRECCLRFLAQIILENCTNIPENIIVKLINYAEKIAFLPGAIFK